MRDIYSEVSKRRQAGQPTVLVTVVACEGHVPTDLAGKMLVDASGLVAGTIGGGAVEKLAIADGQAALAARCSQLKEYRLDDREVADGAVATGMICGGRMSLFFEVIGVGTRAYLFGAGHVGRALRETLAPLDFEVVFVDYRPEQLVDLPGPHLVAGADYTTLPELAELDESYVVIATHSHVCDERVLLQILAAGVRPRYLGVVASRRKRGQMLAGLREHLGGQLDLDWIHIPVGLHLGGNTPAALALSIAAEMQACRHGINGHAHMRDRTP